jgi:alkylhydroperoxidase/carboxymuconolactone decarboxylase family protein YurZ
MTEGFFERGKRIAMWADNQTSWQGLTDDEIKNILTPIASYDVFELPNEAIKLARAIEQALKEKNG